MKTKDILILISASVSLLFSSCEKDFLERKPLSEVTPNEYLVEESQLAAYAIKMYVDDDQKGIEGLPVFGYFDQDSRTDSQARRAYNDRYVPGEWQVGQSGGQWSFTDIFQCNYFLQTVVPRYNAGEISGNANNIKHYIGEMYF